MTYGEARDASLFLINQESIAGTIIPGSYNNQQDYLNRIPNLINDAQIDIATTVKRIPATVFLSDLPKEERGAGVIYTLPENLWQRDGRGLLVPRRNMYTGETVYERFNGYRLLGRDKMLLEKPLSEDTILEYYRYPRLLSLRPQDSDELDNVTEVHRAIPYYVAAQLVISDDAFLYASLYNTYEEKKNQMMELRYTEAGRVEDVYFSGGGWA